MVKKNNFYVAKLGDSIDLFFGYSWSSGSFESNVSNNAGATTEIEVKGYARFVSEITIKHCTSVTVYFLDENKAVLRSKVNSGIKIDVPIDSDVRYIAIDATFSVEYSRWTELEYSALREVRPYYKNIKKQFQKENNQMFFRESLNGSIKLRGSDYEYVDSISIEDNVGFYIYRNGKVYAENEFNKTDCKINHSEYSIELKLKPKDTYDKILNGYDKTHDLLKMPIRKSVVNLTKRCAIQLYFQGDNTITNYAGGTYWEDEVAQPVDDDNSLEKKYYFSKGPSFNEINLSGFNYDINTVYKMNGGKTILNGTQIIIVNGIATPIKSCISFTKKYSAGDSMDTTKDNKWLSNGMGADANHPIVNAAYEYIYDMYQIEIYFGEHNRVGRKIYQSESIYANDSNFLLTQGQIYKMIAVSQNSPYKEPEPESFYLGEYIITRYLWGRLLCDVNVDADGLQTYDLPYDDFASERENFTKCIGLNFSSSNGMKLVHFAQSELVQDNPTPFGVNNEGKYFVAPRISGSLAYELYPYPFARSTWGNTSLWVAFEEAENSALPSVENFLKKFYKPIVHKDCMEVGAVIKALLEKIDSTIKFDSTSEYSEFLYGSVDDTVGKSGQRIFITQKSNVLKGEYDQAAQKGELTFGQVMNMLKNCFRCYWYIDSDRRFRIEHIRYFMNGQSYSVPEVQYDLTNKYDKFNKKQVLYGQSGISYSKSELKSRYEFAWADNSTEMMGGGFYVDVRSNYIEKGSTESINVELFTSDIDFMMFAPERFSQDGFALMITDSSNTVPIVHATAYNQQNTGVKMINYVQNYYASFLHLFNNYLYDMPAETIISSADNESGDKKFYVQGIKKFIQQDIRFQPGEAPELYKLIGTSEGEGSIESMSIDIDNGLVEATLLYSTD